VSTRFSIVYGDTFKFEFWLVFSRDGSMRLSRGQPGSLARGERAMSCVAKLPASQSERAGTRSRTGGSQAPGINP
jgi:hypothetical protein